MKNGSGTARGIGSGTRPAPNLNLNSYRLNSYRLKAGRIDDD